MRSLGDVIHHADLGKIIREMAPRVLPPYGGNVPCLIMYPSTLTFFEVPPLGTSLFLYEISQVTGEAGVQLLR